MDYKNAKKTASIGSIDDYELALGNFLVEISDEEKAIQGGFVQYGAKELNSGVIVLDTAGYRVGMTAYFTRSGVLPVEIDGKDYVVVPATSIKLFKKNA